jgi:hypothetical protein
MDAVPQQEASGVAARIAAVRQVWREAVARSRRRTLAIGSSAMALIITLWLRPMAAHRMDTLSAAPPAVKTHGPYSTRFIRAETPISEGGRWANGEKDGFDWTDVRTVPGLAFGTEIGGNRPDPQKYDDSTALLKGTWGPTLGAVGIDDWSSFFAFDTP